MNFSRQIFDAFLGFFHKKLSELHQCLFQDFLMSNFSSQYPRLQRIGHTHPTPKFGATTFIWHFSLWPTYNLVWHDARDGIETALNTGTSAFDAARASYVKRRETFRKSVNAILAAAGSPESFDWENKPFGLPDEWLNQPWYQKWLREQNNPPNGGKPSPKWFPFVKPDAISFSNALSLPSAGSSAECTLTVQAEAHPEHATLAFYLEVPQHITDGVAKRQPPAADIISRIAVALEYFAKKAKDRLTDEVGKPGAVNAPVGGEPDEDDDAHAKVLYETIWQYLPVGVTTTIDAETANSGPLFSSYRGVVVAAEGYGVGANLHDPGTVPHNRFEELPQHMPGTSAPEPSHADVKLWGTESLAVTKAYWPLIRCLGPSAHQREITASKVYDRRAIFISPLGSIVPPSHAGVEGAPKPDHVRFLLLTSGMPNRDSCGRLVERLMSILTLKALALRDWAIIADASEQCIMRGQELDAIVDYWIEGKETKSRALLNLEEAVWPLKDAELKFADDLLEDGTFKKLARGDRGDRAKNARMVRKKEDEITKQSRILATHMIESDLLLSKLAQEVGKIGSNTAGGLAYRLFKASHYAKECLRLVDSVEMKPMDGWVSLEQNFRRGVEPVFDSNTLVRERLESLRRRIQLVTEMVQTGAIFEQQRKTSENTDAIRKISRRMENYLIKIESHTKSRFLLSLASGLGSMASAAFAVFSFLVGSTKEAAPSGILAIVLFAIAMSMVMSR